MFANQQILPLFPTMIAAQEVTADRKEALNRALAAAVRARRGAGGDERQAWRSPPDLFLDPAFAELTGYAVECGLQLLGALQAEHSGLEPITLTAQIEPAGTMQPPSLQPNAYLSGVYIAQGGGQDQLRFWDPRPQVAQIAPPVRERTPMNSVEMTIPVQPGRLLLFPAWLLHGLLPAPAPRISFSFALVFRDFADAIAPPRWTGLTAGRKA